MLNIWNSSIEPSGQNDEETIGLYKELRKAYQSIPSQQVDDPEFRRLKYIRYADDILLGYIGTKTEVEAIKRELAEFLTTLKLELSEKKTLITHAHSGRARFLNYDMHSMKNDGWRTKRRRSANGQIQLSIPQEVISQWKAKVKGKHGIHPRTELMTRSDYDIVSTFEVELQGLIKYYSPAHSVTATMNTLRYMYEQSLVKTLAAKHHMTTATIYQKYTMYTRDGRKVIAVQIPRTGKKPLTASFGKRPIQRKRDSVLTDEIATVYVKRTELLIRLLAETCELCGRKGEITGHHIQKLKDLQKRYQGRKDPPAWAKKMIAMRRNTLFVCEECHQRIHNGTYDGTKLI